MIEFTEKAALHLDQAFDYIALTNSAEVAEGVRERILNSVRRLESFPLSGRKGRVRGTRELIIPKTPFLAAYKVDGAGIIILAIYHGTQGWPKSL